jgi:hypothetical protein
MGMPLKAGAPAFPNSCDVEEHLRTCYGERVALLKMRKPEMREAQSIQDRIRGAISKQGHDAIHMLVMKSPIRGGE